MYNEQIRLPVRPDEILEYIRWTKKVWTIKEEDPTEGVQDYAVMALGLCGESGELQEAILHNDSHDIIVKEFGDCLYYWAKILDSMKFQPILGHSFGATLLKAPKGWDEHLVHQAAKIAEVFKKIVRGDESLDQNLGAYLADYLWVLSKLLDICGISLSHALSVNKSKIEDRMTRKVLKGSGNNR